MISSKGIKITDETLGVCIYIYGALWRREWLVWGWEERITLSSEELDELMWWCGGLGIQGLLVNYVVLNISILFCPLIFKMRG